MAMLLGRQLLGSPATTVANDAADCDEVLLRIQRNDRFFCDTMELIPAQYYFPTDEEENWIKSAPKVAKKYHKNVMALKAQESSKKSLKRAKFNPAEQKTNEERQIEAAEEEKAQKTTQTVTHKPLTANPTPTAANMESLKERLAAKIQQLREERKADGKAQKKRKDNATASSKHEPVSKKRKTSNGTGQSKAKGNNDTSSSQSASESAHEAASSSAPSANEISANGISYGSLLLDDQDKQSSTVPKTRNGQSIRNIKNLLKKAERNKQRLEELKKTEEGRAVVQAKGWEKALKQAAGESVMDDPKLLRNKLKKKEKKKAKSAKEWAKRVATQEQAAKEKQQKRAEKMKNKAAGGAAASAAPADKASKKPTRKAGNARGKPRAGFEGKKGEAFLNSEKKK